MNDEEFDKIVRLNEIICNAQRAIQNGESLQQVWNALYIPPELLYVAPPRAVDE